MLRRPLQPRCDPQHLIGRRSIGLDIGHVGCAGRERSGLVEGDHAHAGELLHDLPAPDETASPREPPDPKRGRQGSRQPQPARARHDQHGEAGEQRLVEGRPLRPEEDRETGEDEHRGNERGGDPVRQALRMALLGQRLPHQAGDLRPTGRGARAGAANEERPVVIDAAGEDCDAGRLGYRPALPRDHGLVDMGRALDDDAVHGDALSWPDQHQRTDGHLPRRNAHLGATVDHRHAFLLRRKHRRQIAHRTGAPRGLEITAEREQDQEHGGGVEVDFGAAHHDGQRGIRIGHSGAKRDQGGRSQTAVGRGAPGLLEQWPAEDQQCRRCQRPQNQVDHLADLGIRLLERARIEQQAEEHDVHGQERADSQPDQQPRGFGLLALAAGDLEGEAAAIAAEAMVLALDLALVAVPADRQQAVAAKSGRARGGAHSRCRCPPIGTTPRAKVIRPSSTMKAPANATPRCRQRKCSMPRPPDARSAATQPFAEPTHQQHGGKGAEAEGQHDEQPGQSAAAARRLGGEGIDQGTRQEAVEHAERERRRRPRRAQQVAQRPGQELTRRSQARAARAERRSQPRNCRPMKTISRPDAIARIRCAPEVGGASAPLLPSPAARKPTSPPMKQ